MGRPSAAVDPIHLRNLASQFSDEEIAKRLGLARVTVTSARRRHGIPSFTELTGLKRRDGAMTHGGRRREVLFNEGYFADLTSEDAAYFLGLLFADGTVLKRGNTMEITLGEPDDHVLYDFARCINGSSECQPRVKHVPSRKKIFHRFVLCSKTLATDLISWGMKPGQKQTIELMRPVPAELTRHFIRGFWDGDGHIGRKAFEAGVQSLRFAEQLQTMITSVGGQRPTLRESKTPMGIPFYVIDAKAKRLHSFRQELYRDARFFMERKHRSFLENWC